MSATVEAIRAAVVARVETVPNVGPVHGYEPYLKTERALRDLYTLGDRLCGWHVRRVATQTLSPSVGRIIERHRWLIRGFMAFEGASELIFDGLVEAIRAALEADETLGGLIAGMTHPQTMEHGLQLEDAAPVRFCGVLCHSARLGLVTEVYR